MITVVRSIGNYKYIYIYILKKSNGLSLSNYPTSVPFNSPYDIKGKQLEIFSERYDDMACIDQMGWCAQAY